MPTLYPLSLTPWFDQQICDAQGHPLVGGTLTFYLAGTSTPAAVWADENGVTEHTNPVVLDAAGRPTMGAIYVAGHGYKVLVKDVNGVDQYTRDMFEDVGQVFAENFGTVLSEGSKDVTSGFTVLETDRLVTVASTGGADPCVINLLPAVSATQPLTIKNMGTIVVSVVPNGVDTLEGLTAAGLGGGFEIPEAVSPLFPAITIVSDGVSAWWITSSHF